MGAGLFAWHDSKRHAAPDLWIGLTALFTLFVLPCFIMLWLMRRLRIVAEVQGLWIYGAFTTQFIAWRDIEDYELRPAPNAATAHGSWIRHDGKWRRLPQFYTNTEVLRAHIQNEATASRARDWQLSVARDDAENWPKTYAYRDPSGGKMFAIVAAGLLFICAMLATNSFGLSTTPKPDGDAIEKWGRIAALLLPLLFIHYAIMRSTKRRGAHTIRADQNALTLVCGENPTRVAWDEISDYFIEDVKGAATLPQYVLEGAGERIVFRQEITNFGELKALITARAVNAKSREWRHHESADSDTLGGAQSLWRGGVAGVGRKIYHYRTRTLRAMLVLGVFFMSVFLISYICSSHWRTRDISDLVAWVLIFLPISVITVSGALAFWHTSIQTDENGITHRNIWGERTLNWGEVESFSFNGHFYTLKGKNTTIRYWLVAAGESLQAEIEARAGLKMRRAGQVDDDE